MPVTATVITFNEAANIEAALASLSWADEIIVVDSQSTDDTAAIARKFTDKVIVRPWPGYIAVDRTAAASTSHWDDRHDALAALAKVQDPAAFAKASANTRFGGIEVFVLHTNPQAWTWGDLRFSPSQFSPSHFTVRSLPKNTVVAIRNRR